MLVLGALCSRVLTHGFGDVFAGLAGPLDLVVAPLRDAYWADKDLALAAYLLWQFLLLAALWAWFGGQLHRLFATDLSQGRTDGPEQLRGITRRRYRTHLGARVLAVLSWVLPLVGAAALALLGRIDGMWGGLLFAGVVLLAIGLALVSVMMLSLHATAGFLTGPAIAADDSDIFGALSRAFTYARAGLPWLVGMRLFFLLGVVLGSGFRLVRTALVVLLAYGCLRLGAGDGVIDRALAIIGAGGAPEDAARLGISWSDYLVAAVMGLGFGALLVAWLADLVARFVAARVAVYLLARRRVDRVPVRHLRTLPRHGSGGGRDAAAQGFVMVNKIDEGSTP